MTSKAGYWLSPVPLLLGLAVAAWVGWGAVTDVRNAFARIVVPGTGFVTLSKPGTYLVFHETRSHIDGRIYEAKDIPGMTVEVVPDAGGTPIPARPPNLHSTYTVGSSAGESLLEFTITEPGNYRVTARYADGQNGPKTVLAIGTGIVGIIFRAVAIAIGSLILGFALSLALLLTTYFRRRRLLGAAAAV
ncbi:MAG TPA: hypothetical protein VGG57_20675 [Stellaceae bacterium]|jgi:hypothetical protein